MTFRDLLRFLVSASISLLILILFYLLLTSMEQGLTIVVELFYHPACLVLTVLILGFLSLILSHYPYYFDIALGDRDHLVRWKSTRRFGLLYYFFHISEQEFINEQGPDRLAEFRRITNESSPIAFLRRHIGLLCYAMFYGILVYVESSVFDVAGNEGCSVFTGMDIFKIALWIAVSVIVHLLLMIYFKDSKGRIKQLTSKEDVSEIDSDACRFLTDRIKLNLHFFSGLLVLNFFFLAYLFWCTTVYSWNETNLKLLMLVCHLNAFQYIYFRHIRPWFIYYFKPDAASLEDTEENGKKNDYPKNRLKVFDDHEKKYTPLQVRSPFAFLKHLASTPNYLGAMSLFGLFLFFLVFAGGFLSDTLIQQIHPIPLLLSIFIIYYSAAVILLKSYIYLKSNLERAQDDALRILHKLAAFGIILVFILAFILIVFTGGRDNDLHTLELVPKERVSSLEAFASDFNFQDTVFLIGSYGGGLKANSWNMLLLNHIANTYPGFLGNVLCMSGVSGGALGIASYTALRNHYDQDDLKAFTNRISAIGEMNMLSNDLFGLFVKDFWREYFGGPESFGGNDRANLSMKFYAKAIHDSMTELSCSMTDYWLQVRDKGYYPALIFNSTATSSACGVACSIEDVNLAGCIDVLDFGKTEQENYSLSFFGAASTANRFPILSPAARISGKGHFVDGGYFDNSGLLNAWTFYRQVLNAGLLENVRAVRLINVVNDKNLYILDKLKSLNIDSIGIDEEHDAEWLSIAKAIINTERLPRYLRNQFELDSIDIVNLHMPYIFDLEDVKSLYKIKNLQGEKLNRVQNVINLNREEIISALDESQAEGGYRKDAWGIVTPPLGRLLSKPAVWYQRAMLRHHAGLNSCMDRLGATLKE